MKKLLPLILIVNIFFFLFLLIKTDRVLAADDECNPNDATPQNSRPASCNLCLPRTTTTTSCATTFNLYTKIEYTGSDDKIIKKYLDFKVDPTGANVPFAGKAQDESENKYLADYLEGTNEYYANYNDQTTITNYQGVLRKLTPLEYQNQLKKQLIARAPERAEVDKENRIHNYEIVYVERVCWDFPFWMDAGEFVMEKLSNFVLDSALERFNKGVNKILSFFHIEKRIDIKANLNFPEIGHYCLYADYEKNPGEWLAVKINKIFHRMPVIGEIYDGLLKISKIPGLIHVSLNEGETARLTDFLAEEGTRLPPNPAEEDYIQKYLVWKEKDNGKWYRLWQAVPMVSREDAIGEIKPYDGKEDPKDIVNNEDDRLEKVPHLARLFETSKIIGQTLIPTQTKVEGEMKEPPTTPDYPETNPPAECFKENYLTGEGDTLCCQAIPGKVTVEFENPLYEECHQGLENLKAKCKTLPIAAKAEILACTQEIIDLESKCRETQTQEVSQGVGVKLSHPFLDEIWQNTTYPETGFFNIFRPNGVAAFEDIDAATNISYSSSGDVSPQKGLFFFPHLGGVQKAKEYVVNQALWPLCDKNILSQCPTN